MSTTAQQISSFEKHGYLTGIDTHGDAHVARIRNAFDELEAREGSENCEIGLQERHIDVKFIWELASDARILDCIEALMGPDIMLLTTHFFLQIPADQAKVRRLASGCHVLGVGTALCSDGLVCDRRQRRCKRLHARDSRFTPARHRQARQVHPCRQSAKHQSSLGVWGG